MHVLNRLVHALGTLAALLTTEFALVAMPVLDESIEQGNTRQLAKWARNSLHMIKTTPPKRCRRRRHKHHRIRAGQHTSVAIGRYDLGMQGGVVEQLRQIRSQTSLVRILVRFNDARQRMRIDGARQAAVERLRHCRGRALDRTLSAQQIPKRGAASGAAMTWVDERERSQAVLANKRTGALAAGTSCWRQCLERLACHPLGKR